jgi:hypothetical protein
VLDFSYRRFSVPLSDHGFLCCLQVFVAVLDFITPRIFPVEIFAAGQVWKLPLTCFSFPVRHLVGLVIPKDWTLPASVSIWLCGSLIRVRSPPSTHSLAFSVVALSCRKPDRVSQLTVNHVGSWIRVPLAMHTRVLLSTGCARSSVAHG